MFSYIQCNSNAQSLASFVFRRSTFTAGVLTKFQSFLPFSYKVGLIRTSGHLRSTTRGLPFLNNIKELTKILENNLFPSRLLDNIVNHYFNKLFASTERMSTGISPSETSTLYFKLTLIGPFSSVNQR